MIMKTSWIFVSSSSAPRPHLPCLTASQSRSRLHWPWSPDLVTQEEAATVTIVRSVTSLATSTIVTGGAGRGDMCCFREHIHTPHNKDVTRYTTALLPRT